MLFSRKKIWRRSSCCYEETLIYKIKISTIRTCKMEEHFKQMEMDEVSSTSSISSISPLQYSSELDTAEHHHIPKKSVRFANSVRVVLIPMRDEFIHLFPDLYYTPEDCMIFKDDAFNELDTYRHSSHCKQRKLILMKRGLMDLPLHVPQTIMQSKPYHMSPETKSTNFYTSVGIPLRFHAHTTSTWHTTNYNDSNHSSSDQQMNSSIDEDDLTDRDSNDTSPRGQWDIDLNDDEPCTIKEASMILYQPWMGDDDYYYVHTYSSSTFMYSI